MIDYSISTYPSPPNSSTDYNLEIIKIIDLFLSSLMQNNDIPLPPFPLLIILLQQMRMILIYSPSKKL